MSFKLEVPLQLSQIKDFTPGEKIKVALAAERKVLQSQIVAVNEKGYVSASFVGGETPKATRLIVGPASASDEQLAGLQTLSVPLTAKDLVSERLSPVLIADYYWRWWLYWCRDFTITGRVVCPTGEPVPYATVCAYDVDYFWWWFSEEQLGCQTTDANGFFQINFRRCCGFWWWWWWIENRQWQLSTELAERLLPLLRRDPKLKYIPAPTARPDLSIFERLLTTSDVAHISPRQASALSPHSISAIEGRLRERIPNVNEASNLRLWPWFPWNPWWDCDVDLIFRVTQNCYGQTRVVVDEGYFDIRWDIPTNLNVTLVANESACCGVQPPPPPEGNCVVLSSVCGDAPNGYPVSIIGGNISAPAAPAGFVNPGLISDYGDRPFADSVSIYGVFGSLVAADYYEFEYSADGGVTFNSLPTASVEILAAQYFGPGLFGEPGFGPHATPAITKTINGRLVTETRQHFEANNAPGTWGFTHLWTYDWGLLMVWLTSSALFNDQTYQLRVRTWLEADLIAGNIANSHILPTCDTKQDNNLVLTLDNRLEGPAFHPADHPCGAGTVHTCTTEPDTHFISVKFLHADNTTTDLPPCSNDPQNNHLRDGDILQIDFYAHDPDGHLAYYELYATYGDSLTTPVLGAAGVALTPGAPYLLIPPAAQVGPDYSTARAAQGAVAPIWNGGTVRLQVPAANVFPQTCCYQLVLRAFKRTIVGCYDGLDGHQNLSEYSFLVIV
jgi:hypothetical protein